MHFILPYFIIILVVIQLYIKKSDTSQKNNIKKFWEREQKANATRKKDISTLKYIEWDTTLPVKENNTLLSDILKNNPEADSAYNKIISVKDKNIINLTEYSNTDLKLKYGILNFKKLSEYDDNFTKFVSMLPDYYNRLKDAGYESLGNELLELAVEQGADSKNVYSLLANAFISMSKADRLAELIEKAKQLNSLSRDGIVSMLESLQADTASAGN